MSAAPSGRLGEGVAEYVVFFPGITFLGTWTVGWMPYSRQWNSQQKRSEYQLG